MEALFITLVIGLFLMAVMPPEKIDDFESNW